MSLLTHYESNFILSSSSYNYNLFHISLFKKKSYYWTVRVYPSQVTTVADRAGKLAILILENFLILMTSTKCQLSTRFFSPFLVRSDNTIIYKWNKKFDRICLSFWVFKAFQYFNMSFGRPFSISAIHAPLPSQTIFISHLIFLVYAF